MGGGGHGHTPPIPDWKKYKVEDVPQLVEIRNLLAKQGLKDPWLRNEVWKYECGNKYTTFQKWMKLGGRGMKWGFLAAVITTAIGAALPDDHHGHGDHHGEGHH